MLRRYRPDADDFNPKSATKTGPLPGNAEKRTPDVAEGGRFELPDPEGSPVFKTGAFSLARPPLLREVVDYPGIGKKSSSLKQAAIIGADAGDGGSSPESA